MTASSDRTYQAAKRAAQIDQEVWQTHVAKQQALEERTSRVEGRVDELFAHLGLASVRNPADRVPGSLRPGERPHA